MKKLLIILSVLALLTVTAFAKVYSVLYNNYSNEKAVEYLDSHAERHSQNLCAKYVRRAIGAGGCPTFLQPLSACGYESFLPDLGFSRLPSSGYIPRKGDIVVFAAIPGHKNGHIAMYDGRQWVSDFKQRTMYSHSAYRSQGTHSFWRRADGKKWRKVSVRAWLRSFHL